MPKNKNGRYLGQGTIGPKIKKLETQQIIYHKMIILCLSLFTKDYNLKSNCIKDISHSVSLYPKMLEQK